MNDRLVTYILTEVSDIAKRQYPNSVTEQLHWQLGFVTAQLAAAMRDDTARINKFKQCIGPAAKKAKRG
jgi:hypothetical protein